ncbi:endo alpha-1,4 polygalactosaminidase [Kouleothrix aurantiaca]|uniref:Endo alpha-1,4 polygalactosaminidase n=1 Tax=Kouleothrix aurantiaca TaxID=186479 RepID=A0A0P9D3F3_9CHLR|nr:endo alpha-1,4 polygalactosaminidase [Kouleothrix aurantiaca]
MNQIRLVTMLLAITIICASQPTTAQHSAVQQNPAYLPVAQANLPWWTPDIHDKLQIQFTDVPIDQSIAADVYDVDMFDTTADLVASLHSAGYRVLCYINVGAWEDWRPDKADFLPSVLGKDYAGWPGERWLDIRQIDVLGPIMQARFDLCKAKGFDGVEPDNTNGYLNDTGFNLTYQDQIIYNTWLAAEAHRRGLAIGLKNDTEQANDLVSVFDFSVTEGCLAEGWCADASVFVENAKPVFAIEYTDMMTAQQFLTTFCRQARALQLNAVLKHRNLDAWSQYCP